ncbi:MAG TPA: IclR family transcriptional regulator [Caulobacteraceae bacterium]|jgi:DNA-binding IclR family transcriptional regulator|nr:IclR family transcriptional regulator [Caulobacteraceae bacterium]
MSQLTPAPFTDAVSGESSLASVDLVLTLIELLAHSPRPRGVSEIARALGVSKARAHRHLRALVAHGYVRQEVASERYEIAVKLMVLGEAVRDRFDVLTAMRGPMATLREASGLAITASALVEGQVVVLELLPGRNLIEFGVRPGAALDLHATAHGQVALAFGPAGLMSAALAKPLKAWTAATLTRKADLVAAVEAVRAQGWASAPDQMMPGVGALAAPVFDHAGAWAGTIAAVGGSQAIPARPAARQVAAVTGAADEASRALGWRTRAA